VLIVSAMLPSVRRNVDVLIEAGLEYKPGLEYRPESDVIVLIEAGASIRGNTVS